MPVMSCSGRFVVPFLKVLSQDATLGSEVAGYESRPLDQRVDADETYRMIQRWSSTSGDTDLGLRAADASGVGCGGAIDFAFHTSETLRDAILLTERYSHLYNDAIEITLLIESDRASIRFTGALERPRPVVDFVLGCWFRNYLRPHLAASADLQCHLTLQQPASIELYRSTFDRMRVEFAAPFDGFSFDVRALDRPLASADRALHALHRQHLEVLQSSLASSHVVAPRVRGLIATELQHGHPSSSMVARKLSMSRRTLVRRLRDEDTSFRLQLDAVRRNLGLRLIAMPTLSLTEISNLLGFSCVQAFHRAFRRWTGQTPTRYRESSPGRVAWLPSQRTELERRSGTL